MDWPASTSAVVATRPPVLWQMKITGLFGLWMPVSMYYGQTACEQHTVTCRSLWTWVSKFFPKDLKSSWSLGFPWSYNSTRALGIYAVRSDASHGFCESSSIHGLVTSAPIAGTATTLVMSVGIWEDRIKKTRWYILNISLMYRARDFASACCFVCDAIWHHFGGMVYVKSGINPLFFQQKESSNFAGLIAAKAWRC